MIQTGTIIGRLGADPETRYAKSGTAVLTCSVAVSLWRKQQGGEYGESTQWWNVTVFGRHAETLASKLRKGSRVVASGEFELRTFEKRNGSQGFSLDMNASILKGLDKDQAGEMLEETDSYGHKTNNETASDFGDIPF
jgi:single-strand DNA-binding protein